MSSHVILAPVPLLHLESAAAALEPDGKAVFATGLELPSDWEGRKIYFYASSDGYVGDNKSDLAKVPFLAVYSCYVKADKLGEYDGAGRPETTDTDGKSIGFYEVSGFHRLPKPLFVAQFHRATGRPFAQGFIPHFPIAARL